PHVDSYDVFLLQAFGRRRWRISRQLGLRVKHGSISNIEGFHASSEWVLDAGDMLYLPPGVAHEGIAIGECMTYSIGFRAPSYQQLLERWFAEYAERAVLRGRYEDEGAAATTRAAALPAAMTREVHAKLAQHRPHRADTERFLLRYLTEPKATTFFEAPSKFFSRTEFRRRAASRGLELDRKTRIIHSDTAIGINGEWIKPTANALAHLKTLGDQRALSPQLTAGLPATTWSLLHDWYSAGWIVIAD
ncbi:MAG TPA: cupin domain-containing protein, partial [Burkholderiaceae bacterium]|nr:cupin domain-containing protein [Burkholderiaceae bacterium]